MKALIIAILALTGFMAHASENRVDLGLGQQDNGRVVYQYNYNAQEDESTCEARGGIIMTDSQTGKFVNCMPGRAPMRPDDRYRFCSQYALDHRDQGLDGAIAFEQCKSIWPIITIPTN